MPQGSLALYRRHLRTCNNGDKGNRWTRCQCPIWVQGSIGGETIGRSLSLEGKLLRFCAHRGPRHLRDLSVERLRGFRRSWTYSPLSAAKPLEYLRAFLRFCVEVGWNERNRRHSNLPGATPADAALHRRRGRTAA